MERINHINIIKVCCRCLISKINRVLKWNIPDWECLKLGISSLNSMLIFMVKLRKACSHLSTSRTRCSNNYKWSACLDKFILSVAFITYNLSNIIRIACYLIMLEILDSMCIQNLNKIINIRLLEILGNAYASNKKSVFCKCIYKS